MKKRMILKAGRHSLTRTLVLLVALGACMATQAFGASTWNNPGVGNWSDGANWTGGEPASGSDAVTIANGGTAVCGPGEICGSMTIGGSSGQSGTIRLDTSTASLSNMTALCALANSGTGTIIQTSGHFYSELGLRLGYYATGYGRYEMSGGTAVLGPLTVGRLAPSEVFQSGGTVTLAGASSIANGLYELTGGTLTFNGKALNLNNNARMVVDGATAAIDSTGSAVTWYIGSLPNSDSTLEIKQGFINVNTIYLGHQGTGTVTQTGGIVKQSAGASISLGSWTAGTGRGIWNLFGGTLEVARLGSWPKDPCGLV